MPIKDYQAYIDKNEIYLFNIGEAQQAYATFGCRRVEEIGMHRFLVWAPNARNVSVVGDFNGWDASRNRMERLDTGVFAAFIPGLQDGDCYKYSIQGYDGKTVLKADPFAFHAEVRPATASKVWSLGGYGWGDGEYLRRRLSQNVLNRPMAIYEMHIDSWRRREGYAFANLRDVADELSAYLVEMGFTHVEIMPVTEYPLDDSWGYQVTGYYAVTSRYGTPQDFMYFVDTLHAKGIGVIMDWVPAHFPRDEHGLARFDGTCLYEHQNPMQADHPQWGTLIFNYGRPEVVSFLISSAMFFFDVYHIDGIRADAVTSMLYLDYARNPGEYVPNENGGNIDYTAVAFLQKLNAVILTRYPGAVTIAEESTSYPLMTRPPYDGGLGFVFKWNMGFMHDTLKYMSMDPFFRHDHHEKLTFSMHYAFTENFILPYSHDEVVHGKKSLLGKMYGTYDEKFASLRVLLGFMYAHPGKKLLFMGGEFGQFIEWDHRQPLDWFLLRYEKHRRMRQYVKALNAFYTSHRALYEIEDGWDGFTWLNVDNAGQSSISFLRRGKKKGSACVCAFNFTPVPVDQFVIGLPSGGALHEAFSSDDALFGGGGRHQTKSVAASGEAFFGQPYRAVIDLPPLTAVYFDYEEKESVG
ncbi:MAG: 1,4-alpha-glucan branching protein GlgB [Smithellaceae bacterium]|nr:1,4-alpha-glucan branching protein GlgB [Smithellaceae bacterium]